VLVLVALVASALAAGVDGAGATSECRGLMACVPVAGPWVVVPVSQRAPRPEVQYQLKCPKGYVVAGVDAEVTDQGIDLWFLGASGAPVGPGTTTSQTMVFVARYVGSAKTPPTFRPHIGCVTAAGGGGRRTRTAATKVNPPGRPAIRRVRTFRITAERRAYAVACRADERVVAGYGAVAFHLKNPPSASLVAGASAMPMLARNHVTVTARSSSAPGLLQVAALCAGGK
jgi:hypothetical protein